MAKSKKLEKLKKVFFILAIVLCVVGVLFIIRSATIGTQNIVATIANNYYKDSNLYAVVDVKDSNSGTSIACSVTAEVVDSKGFGVKGSKKTYSKDENNKITVELPLNEVKENEKYFLKVTSRKGLLSDTKKFNLNITASSSKNGIISLDKGIYKPNDTINYRLLLLNNDNNKPVEDEVSISILDGNANRVYIANTKTSSFGIVSGSFTLGDDLNSGVYKIQVNSKGYNASKSFKVNPYIVPQFEVNIKADKDSYIVGDTAHITVDSQYFFGEPVKNATVEVKVNGSIIAEQAFTDNDGKYTFDYEVKNTEPLSISAEVEDESHAYVEGSKTVYASSNVFNVEVVPEYGELIKNVSNRLYVLTSKPDGSPIKARTTLKIGSIEKQVLTDESGVSYIDLTSDDVSSVIGSKNSATVDLKISSQDYEGHKVEINNATISCNASSKFALKTDKIKYNLHDDIVLSMDNVLDTTYKTVMVAKGDKVLKLYTTDENQATINLGDVSGLIDIYVSKANTNYTSYYTRNYSTRYSTIFDDYSYVYNPGKNYTKKTVFIIPTNSLSVDINLDKEEYAPGDNLKLQINSKNNGTQVESAALVSILDNAILSLADNDLSIDNVKLALEDIELSDDITAADLYAMVMEDKDPAKLEALLIKQSSDPVSLSNAIVSSQSAWESKAIHFIIGIIVTEIGGFILLFMFFFKDNEHPFKLTVASFLVFNILLGMFNSSNVFATLIPTIIFGIIVYKLILEKHSDVIFEVVFYYFLLGNLVYFLIEDVFYLDDWYRALYLVPGLLAIALRLSMKKKTPKKEILKVLEKHLYNFLYNFGCALLIILIAILLNENSDFRYGFGSLIVGLSPIVLFILKRVLLDPKFKEKFANKEVKETKKKSIINGKIQINIDGKLIVGIVVIIIGMAMLNSIKTFSSSNIQSESTPVRRQSDTLDYALDVNQFSGRGDDSSAAASASSSLNLFDGLTNSFSKTISSDEGAIAETAVSTAEAEDVSKSDSSSSTVQDSGKTEKIRNLFLESLAFLPEVIVNSNGTTQDIPISDNITTWNIQVIANTKDGNLGYNSKEFKVFKDFFVNFELPKNSVVTDKFTLPVTVYNYSNVDLTVDFSVENAEWFSLYENISETHFTVGANSNKVVYVPIEVLKSGNNKLRITAKANGVEDIIEKSFEVKPNGYNVQKVISSGKIKEDFSGDYFTTDTVLEGTHNVKFKIYPNMISQQIENIDSILKMPTGCFEQTSSSLYPDALVLKYLNSSKTENEQAKQKALDYVNKGYQRLLTFEVQSTPGGFSLYGRSPAELALTAYGYMELYDISKVYDIDQNVLSRMHDYLYKEQNINGSFNVNTSSYFGSHLANNDLALNAYVIWCLSEVDPNEAKLQKSISYLEGKLSKSEDTYTIALMANAFANVNSSKTKEAIDILIEKTTQGENGTAYVESKIRDYYGCYGRWQNVQTTALASLALTRSNTNNKTNEAYLKYLLAQKDKNGTFGTTQATVLSLKALNAESDNNSVQSQTIKVSYAGQTKEIKIDEKEIMNQSVTFENVPLEGKYNVDIEKGRIYYEIISDYYTPFDFEAKKENDFKVEQYMNPEENYRINTKVNQVINITNSGNQDVANGLIKINIPQGMTVLEESLSKLVVDGKIQKYDYNYNTLNLYLRNTSAKSIINVTVQYRVLYSENVTGGLVEVYDYYNPEYQGIAEPVTISTHF